MTNTERLRAWHKAQLGTKEYPSGSNNVRYNTDYYGRAVSGPDYKWCVVYQWAGFRECGMPELFYGGGKTASCSALMTYAKQHGQWVTEDFREGDLLLLDFTGKRTKPTHIGWIDEVCPDALYTYEGNTSAKENDNGGTVQRRLRRLSQAVGAVRPDYAPQEKKTAAPVRNRTAVMLPVLRSGMKGGDVKIMQTAVTAAGFDCGGTDGQFGTNTGAAVRAFQSSRGLETDGIVGVDTWTALFDI